MDIAPGTRQGVDPARLAKARESFFERSGDLLAIATSDGYFVEINDAWMRVLGFSRERILNTPYLDLVHPDDVSITVDAMQALDRGERVSGFRNRYLTADGGIRWFEWNSALDPAYDLVFGIARDVTNEQLLKESLHAANEELRARAELRDQFVSTASHELRTPVTSIVGFASTIRDRWDELDVSQVRAFVDIIADQGERLLVIVDALLSMARLDAGAVQVRGEPVAVAPAMASAGNLLDTSDVRISIDGDPVVQADPALLAQVLTNLVTNASRYGSAPIELTASTDGDERVVLAVRDHGDGVPAAFRPYLFDKFAQARRGLTEPVYGTGLGLSIARALVESMDGTLDYEPAEPGSRFIVRLPSA